MKSLRSTILLAGASIALLASTPALAAGTTTGRAGATAAPRHGTAAGTTARSGHRTTAAPVRSGRSNRTAIDIADQRLAAPCFGITDTSTAAAAVTAAPNPAACSQYWMRMREFCGRVTYLSAAGVGIRTAAGTVYRIIVDRNTRYVDLLDRATAASSPRLAVGDFAVATGVNAAHVRTAAGVMYARVNFCDSLGQTISGRVVEASTTAGTRLHVRSTIADYYFSLDRFTRYFVNGRRYSQIPRFTAGEAVTVMALYDADDSSSTQYYAMAVWATTSS